MDLGAPNARAKVVKKNKKTNPALHKKWMRNKIQSSNITGFQTHLIKIFLYRMIFQHFVVILWC